LQNKPSEKFKRLKSEYSSSIQLQKNYEFCGIIAPGLNYSLISLVESDQKN